MIQISKKIVSWDLNCFPWQNRPGENLYLIIIDGANELRLVEDPATTSVESVSKDGLLGYLFEFYTLLNSK